MKIGIIQASINTFKAVRAVWDLCDLNKFNLSKRQAVVQNYKQFNNLSEKKKREKVNDTRINAKMQ